jgi:hypothetical protein
MRAHKMSEDLDKENAEIRNLYAETGLALYLAQVLEHGIVNILVLGYMIAVGKTAPHPITEEKIARFLAKAEEIEQRHYEQTLGALLTSVHKSGISLPAPLVDLLTKALEHRNRLVHRLFRERALEIGNSSGRKSVFAELKDMKEVFIEADTALDGIWKQLALKNGINQQRLADYQDTYEKASRSGSVAEKEVAKQLRERYEKARRPAR